MIKNVHDIQLKKIFTDDNAIYKIPMFQRDYAWKKKNWEALFDDISENDQEYFLGSYICIEKQTANGVSYDIIDGQQRFITLTLFLLAIYVRLSTFHKEEPLAQEDIKRLRSLRRQITCKNGGEYSQKLILQKQASNNDDLSFILWEKGVTTKRVERPEKLTARNIYKAYEYLSSRIDTEIRELGEKTWRKTKIEYLFDLFSRVEATVFVRIEVKTNQDAYKLFAALNDRGLALSAVDLIKNLIIEKSRGGQETENNYHAWLDVLDCLGKDTAVQERFFRHYYNGFRKEHNKHYKALLPERKRANADYPLGTIATKTNLLDIYEKMIRTDLPYFLKDLEEKAQYYAIVLNNAEENKPYTEALKDLERIEGRPSYMLVLYLLANQDSLGLYDRDIKSIVVSLVAFFVRRNITNIPATRELDQIFIDIVEKIRTRQGTEIRDMIRDLLNKKLNDKGARRFRQKLLTAPLYEENRGATSFILRSIEKYNTNERESPDPWMENEKGRLKWTIEHIFPKGENIKDHWVTMIANGNKEKAERYQKDYVHRLGNLTLTAFNSDLSDKPYIYKRDIKDKKGISIGYRNGMFLNKTLRRPSRWTIEDIEERTKYLADLVVKMYRL